jgi:hypothetical protein
LKIPRDIQLKWSYVTHRVDRSQAVALLPLTGNSDPGALVLARVKSIGRHKEIEDFHGVKRALFPGDVIVGVLGHRYATDQFEGRATAAGPMGHLLGIGGVCGEVVSKNEKMIDPTSLEWIGRVADSQGKAIYLRSFAIHPRRSPRTIRARTLLVVGASMNSGKTTTAAQAIRSLAGEGRLVAAAKITGTACRKDPGLMEDGGAPRVLDFTHCGYPSTAHLPPGEVLSIASDLRAALMEEDPEFIVYEIADGIFQRETRILLEDPDFRGTIDAVLFTGTDSVSCEGGVRHLKALGYDVVAVAGLVANSRLGMAEVQASTGIACLNGEMILGGALKDALQLLWAA